MPFQVLNDPNADVVGQSVGNALSSGLQALASHKMEQIQRDNVSKGLRALGFGSSEAHNLSYLDPKSIEKIVSQKIKQPNEEAYAQAILGGVGGAPSAQVSGQSKPRLTGEQALKLAQLRETQQSNIRAENSPYLKSLEAEAAPARTLKEDVKEALRLFDLKDAKGNRIAQVGALSGSIPAIAQNEVTQALRAKFNEIVTKKAQLGKGVPSRMRLLLEQASKPDVWMKPKAIEYLLNSLIKSSTEPELKEQAKDQIIRENGGYQPRNLENLTKERAKVLKAVNEIDPHDYSEDAVISVGGVDWERQGDEWVPYQGEIK